MSQWGTRPSPFSSAEVTAIRALIGGGVSYTDGQLLIGSTPDGLLHAATITAGTGITVTNGNGTITLSAATAAGLTVGTSTITSGTSTRILYDNAGVLGEYTISGSGTVVAMATSPSFTTPTLGVATATSINKMAITAPATSSTLAVADGKTLTASNTLTFTGTDSSSVAFGAGGTVAYLTTRLDQFATPNTDVAWGTNKITGVKDPTSAQDAATKNYVDSIALAGVDWKQAVKYATTAALPTSTYANGTLGVGATLTENSNGALSVDSASPSVGDRILVKNQASAFQNGIYTVTATGSAGAVFVLTRATDYDTAAKMAAGDVMAVTAGTANIDTLWIQTSTVATVGTDAVSFSQFGATFPLAVANGGTGVSSASITAFNNITGFSAAGTTGTTSTNLVFSTSPTFVTPTLGAATATSLAVTTITALTSITGTTGNMTITAGTGNSRTLTLQTTTSGGTATNGIVIDAGQHITLEGVTSTGATGTGKFVFSIAPAVTGAATSDQWKYNNNAVTVTSNAGTTSAAFHLNTFTNSSAATMAITMGTTGAVDGQAMVVRIYDFSAVAQTIGWTNTENSTVSAPLTSNGSTTLPLSVGFIYNGSTSKWRCVASA